MSGLLFSAFNSEAQSMPFLTNGLVAYYAFNGNADDTFGANNGTPYGITYVADRFGNTNAAASFAGNASSYIQIATTNLNLPFPLTVSVWINPTASIGDEGPRIFSTSGYEMTVSVTNGDFNTTNRFVYLNVTSASGASTPLLTTNSIPTGAWSHLVGVWTSNQMALYINGNLSGTQVLSLIPDYSRWPYPAIGVNSGDIPYHDNYGGLIDDLAIYNRALSAQEISELYESFASGIITLPTITISGATNQTYSIQYVTNLSLTNWTTLISNIQLRGSSSYLYPDTNSVGQPYRFYRVVAK